jgi:pyroglutamyl-peptidase
LKLLVTGFGPFPGAPANPSQELVQGLAAATPEEFGASAFKAVVLPTDYRESWAKLRRLYARFAPDTVIHFGLSAHAQGIVVERIGRKQIDAGKLDVSGYAPAFGSARRSGPDAMSSSLPVEAIVAALRRAGFPAALSDDAGGYVCNATLYRSLCVAPAGRQVGFVHLPPAGRNGLTPTRLLEAARIILTTAVRHGGAAAISQQYRADNRQPASD